MTEKAISSPVCGFHPLRAGRHHVDNVPHPVMATYLPVLKTSRTASKTVLTTLFSWALGRETQLVTWDSISDFFISLSP